MTREKVLVTGGAGFIGSTLTRNLLSQGYKVTILDNLSVGSMNNIPNGNSNLKIVAGDIRDFELVSAIIVGQDYVLNLAAQAFIPMSYNLPLKCASVNSLGSLNVFKAALDHKVKRIVHVSSSEVYGSAKQIPMNEEHPLNPRSTYAVAKLAADLWAQTMAFEHNLPVVILRPFNAFGPRDTLPRFIPEIIRQILKKDRIEVGELETSRDYTFVEDLSRAMILALQTEGIEGEVFNFGTGKTHKMSDILKMIKKMTRFEDKEVLQNRKRLRPFDVDLLQADWSKAEKILKWKPKVDFATGLQRTIDWYLNSEKGWGYEFRGWHWSY